MRALKTTEHKRGSIRAATAEIYLIAFILATILGAFLHFLFSLFPNVVTAIFSPVTESVWEHMKLVFWPFLIASAVLTRRRKDAWGAHLLALLIISGLMLLLGWGYHILLGMEGLKFDVASYVVVMAVGFLLAGKLPAKGIWKKLSCLFGFITFALAVALLLFTFLPPDCCLFMDLSGAATWTTIPY